MKLAIEVWRREREEGGEGRKKESEEVRSRDTDTRARKWRDIISLSACI